MCVVLFCRRENESGEDLSVSPAADVMEMLFSVLQSEYKRLD